MRILFTTVSVINHRIEELELLFDSAKKYFLPNHIVDFVLFSDENISINGVRLVKIETPEILDVNYYQFLKVLSLNNINLDDYDFVFVNDDDQMFVDYINDEDLLTGELCILSHFYPKIKTKDNLVFWTDVIEISDPEKCHTMGNFFGGPVHLMKKFVEFCNFFWQQNKTYKFGGINFFSQFPEEILLIKFIIDNNINEKRLFSELNLENRAFMTNLNVFDMENKSNLYLLKNFKLVHNTKCNMVLAKEIFY